MNLYNLCKMNAMHIAARRGDSRIAAIVLEKATLEGGASIVNALSNDRCTPLYIAAKFGHTKIMELLLNKYVSHFYFFKLYLVQKWRYVILFNSCLQWCQCGC